MGMSVLSTVPTPQSIGEAGEKMILTEGRREYESQLAQWQRGAKRKCSVYPLGMCQVWVPVSSMLLQFGNLLERSFIDQHLFKKITPDLLRKYMYLQNQIIASCSDEEQPVLYAGHFQWKTPLSTFPLMNLPETKHLKYSMLIQCSNWNICIRKTWSNPTWNSMSIPLTSVGLCGCKPAQEAAWSICRECLSSKQIFAIIKTNLTAGSSLQGNASVRQSSCTRKRIPLLKLNHPEVFPKRNWHTEKSILQEETIAIAVQALGLRYNNTIFFWVH